MTNSKSDSKSKIKADLLEAYSLLEVCRGHFIDQPLAKHIYKHIKSGYSIKEERMNDNLSLVIVKADKMAHAVFELPIGEPEDIIFMVKGPLDKKLNMCD